jgi:hypothetical protein
MPSRGRHGPVDTGLLQRQWVDVGCRTGQQAGEYVSGWHLYGAGGAEFAHQAGGVVPLHRLGDRLGEIVEDGGGVGTDAAASGVGQVGHLLGPSGDAGQVLGEPVCCALLQRAVRRDGHIEALPPAGARLTGGGLCSLERCHGAAEDDLVGGVDVGDPQWIVVGADLFGP